MALDVWQAIKCRRSTRSFKAEAVPDEVLKKLVLEAGIWAPSGGNAQTWRFVIVTDPLVMEKVKMISPGLLGNPPSVIVICQDLEEAYKKGSDLGKQVLTYMDTAMAAQNIMLAVCSEDLGTCPIASFHPGALQQILHLPSHIVPQLIVSVGVPSKEATPPKRKQEVIWFDEYR